MKRARCDEDDVPASAQRDLIQHLLVERRDGSVCGVQEPAMQDIAKMFEGLTVEPCDAWGSKKLLYTDPATGITDQMVVRLTGAATCVDIGPVYKEIPYEERFFACQQIVLSGHGAPAFSSAVSELKTFTSHLHHFLDKATWSGWTPSVTNSGPILTAGCRYFTPVKSMAHGSPVAIPKSIDPRGFLSNACDSRFVYTDDNVVEYYKYDPDASKPYTALDPREIKDGDIIEAHLGFQVVKSAGKRRERRAPKQSLFLIKLRAITLLQAQADNKDEDADTKRLHIPKRRKIHDVDDDPQDVFMAAQLGALHMGEA